MSLFPEIIGGEKDHIKLSAGEGFMPLSVERIGDNRIAMAHNYIQNGDVMADPDMEIVIDHEQKTASARTFQQDNLAYYKAIEVKKGVVQNPGLAKQFDSFLAQWLENIKEQGYERLAPRQSIREGLREGAEQAARDNAKRPAPAKERSAKDDR